MTDDVKRYDMRDSWTGACMAHEQHGEWIHVEDYDALAERIAAFEALATRAMQCANSRYQYQHDEMQRIVDLLANLMTDHPRIERWLVLSKHGSIYGVYASALAAEQAKEAIGRFTTASSTHVPYTIHHLVELRDGERITDSPTDAEETDTGHTDQVICPWCGTAERRVRGWFAEHDRDADGAEARVDCRSCSLGYFITRHVGAPYTNRITPETTT